MLLIVITVTLLGIVNPGSSFMEWKNFEVKFNLSDGFYKIPLTKEACLKDTNYALMDHDKEMNIQYLSHKDDPRCSFGYDSYGHICAAKACYIKEDVPKRAEKNGVEFLYSFDNKPWMESKTFWGRPVWCNTMLFSDPELIKNGGRANFDGTIGDNVRLKLTKNTWSILPRDECKAAAMGFIKQGCMAAMGVHYFYNPEKSSACEDAAGIFLLFEWGELVGLGFNPFGSFTCSSIRCWNEDPPESVIKVIAPNSPSCTSEWMNKLGMTSTHFYFGSDPTSILCTSPNQDPERCKK